MTTYLSNGSGNDTGNSGGSYSPGTQSVQWIHDHFATDGDIIQIPTGTFTWTNAVNLSKAVTLQGQTMWTGGSGSALSAGAIIRNAGTTAAFLITINSSPNGHSTLSQLAIIDASSVAGAQYVHVHVIDGSGSVVPALIHDCYFETNNMNVFRSINWGATGGVIWNCKFWSHQFDQGAIQFKHTRSWSTPPTMGTADTNGAINVYVENCTFTDIFLDCLDFDDYARTVVRYNTFTNSAMVTHGDDTSLIGGRHTEVYNNTFHFTLGANGGATIDGNGYPLNMNYWWFVRGGSGLCYNNVMDDISSQWWGSKGSYNLTVQNINRNAGPYACWNGGYPSPHQPGWGSDGITVTNTITQSIEPIYVWANSGGTLANSPGVGQYSPDECAHGYLSTTYIQANREFYTGIAKPSWTPYAYPHPLRTSSSGGGGGGGFPIMPNQPPFMPPKFPGGPPTVPVWEDGPGLFANPPNSAIPVRYTGQSQTGFIINANPKPPRNFSPSAAPPSMSHIP